MTRGFLTLMALLVAVPAAAQEAPLPTSPQMVDRVVAVVGDSVVLQSDVLELVERARAGGATVPTEPEALARFTELQLQSLVNELVLIQAAARDSIIVEDAAIEGRVEAAVAQQEQQFGGRDAFERALVREGMSLEQYRQMLRESLRRSEIRNRFMATLRRDRQPPPVSDREVREYFEERGAELGPQTRPATIEFKQVVLAPEPADSAREAALAEAREVLRLLGEGEDFGQLARRFSDDAATRERGGDLGWFRRGRMVPAFERMAFALRPGAVSPVVETAFGFHVIKVERVKGAERQARHILIRPEITADDVARTGERARDLAARVRAGASLDSLIEAVHDDSEASRVGPYPQDSLPAPYDVELASARQGQVVGPFELPGTDRWAIVEVVDVKQAGTYTPDDPDVREQIRRFLQQEKLLDEVIQELRRRTYIDIRT